MVKWMFRGVRRLMVHERIAFEATLLRSLWKELMFVKPLLEMVRKMLPTQTRVLANRTA